MPQTDTKQTRPEPVDQTRLNRFAARLQAEAKRLDLSQAEIARKVGVERAAVNHWFRGRNAPTLAQMVRLSDQTGISLDYLWLDLPKEDPRILALAKRIGQMNPREMAALDTLFGAAATDQRVEKTGYKPRR